MSVDRAQIEHLRSFVATPRCMSYETIRSLDDILDNLEAASAEVADLRRQLEERGDVVRVDAPDKAECVWIANEAQLITGRSIWPDTVDAVLRVVRSRLVPATPPPDVVTVPREYLEMLQSAANRFCSSCRDNNASCSMTARHFGGTGCGAWKLDGTRINALRSGEAGKGDPHA